MSPRIFLVTDPRFSDDDVVRVVREVGTALPPGAFGVQLRDKQRPRAAVRELAVRLRAVTRECGALFVVNRHAELAVDVGADGVHLGRDAGSIAAARSSLGAAAWISIAAHDDADVARAAEERADAVLVSPIFETPGARKGLPRGSSAIASASRIVRGQCAVYALGGVTIGRARACREAGADGVAAIRLLLEAPDAARVAKALLLELAPM
jgi:thiamine-phosphate pyrophosphorylase